MNTSTFNRAETPIAETAVDGDGNFAFDDLSKYGISSLSSDPTFVLVLRGCGSEYSRLVTSNAQQNLSSSTGLFEWVGNTSSRASLVSLDRTKLHSLYAAIEEEASMDAAFSKIQSSSALSAIFQNLFSLPIAELHRASPDIVAVNVPSSPILERSSSTFSVTIKHWSSTYVARYAWALNSVSVGTLSNYSLTTGANDQGSKSLRVRVGSDDGFGALDLAAPYAEKTVSVAIENSSPPVVPNLSRTSPAITNRLTVDLELDTGAGLVNCDSFSRLAITHDDPVAPLSPSAYTIECTTDTTQLLSTILTSTPGTRTIRVWAIDASGTVSAVPRTATVTIDQTAPALTLTSHANNAVVRANITLVGACETGLAVDVTGTGLASAVTPATCSAGAYSAALTLSAGEGLKDIRVSQTDAAGNETFLDRTLRLDTTLPTINITTPTGGEFIPGMTPLSIDWESTDAYPSATPVRLEYSTNGGSTYSLLVNAQPADGPYSWMVPGFNSNQVRIRAIATDQAGNTNVFTTPNFTIDSSAPQVTLLNFDGGGLYRGDENHEIRYTATDANLVALDPIAIAYSDDGGLTWIGIDTGEPNSGTYTWSMPQVTGNNYKVRISATDRVGKVGYAISSTSFAIDSDPPTVTLTSLTGGQTIPGNQNYSITWTAFDANMAVNPISIFVSNDSGLTYSKIADSLPNTGSYTWFAAVPEDNKYRVRVSVVDAAGNSNNAASNADFAVSLTAPVLTQTDIPASYVSQDNFLVYGGVCTDGYPVNIVGPDSLNDSQPCTGGEWDWRSPDYSIDATRTFTFSQTNAASLTTTVSATWTRDTQAPTLVETIINEGATLASSPNLQVKVTVASAEPGLRIRMRQANVVTGDCQAEYADNSWISQTSSTQTHMFSVAPTDSVKKICVWTKDSAGNTSKISPSTGSAGVNFDSVTFSAGNPPVIRAFSVVNFSGGPNDGTTKHVAGEQLRISWDIADDEGLENSPVTLEYTTDNINWITIEQNYGGVAGNPRNYTYDYYGFVAPTSSYFRVRLKAKDMAGNNAKTILSNAQNTGAWSVYAGSVERGDGGDAKAASIMGHDGNIQSFAVHPKSGDIYIADPGMGLRKYDARTGKISTFVLNGESNFDPSGGSITSASRIKIDAYTYVYLAFDHRDRLYLLYSPGRETSAYIYQIDLAAMTYRLIAGGGTQYNGGSSPSNTFVQISAFAFDESNSIYFYTSCSPGTWDVDSGTTSTSRLLKTTINPDGTPGTNSVVAGNCIRGYPVDGANALSTSLTNYQYPKNYSLLVFNNGNAIYYNAGSHVRKIVNGVQYSTSIATTSGNMSYSSSENKIYIARENVLRFTPVHTGNNGEALEVVVQTNGTALNCGSDGIDVGLTCIQASGGIVITPQGQIIFADGINNRREYRIRYIDETTKVRTYVGTKPFYGDGLHRSLAQGKIGPIYYKRASEKNLESFPEGLYFIAPLGPVLGRISTDGMTEIIWGSQNSRPMSSFPAGSPVSSGVTMGTGQQSAPSSTNLLLTFDNDGFPWLMLTAQLVTLGTDKRITYKNSSNSTTYGSSFWLHPTPPAPLSSSTMYAGLSNLTLKKNGLISLGGYYNTANGFDNPGVALRYLDFTANTNTQIMGKLDEAAFTSDKTGGTDLSNLPLQSQCNYGTNGGFVCPTRFVENDPAVTSDDAIYYAENIRLRRISNPFSPGNQTLTTLFQKSERIRNFILTLDKKRIFYIQAGLLYCHAISVADETSYCKNNSANHAVLGPSAGLSTINTFPDNMTWKSENELLISTGVGEVYLYEVPAN